MLYRAMLGLGATIVAAAVFASPTEATAQGAPIRDLQYTDYLKKKDFNGAEIAAACEATEPPGIKFQSSADEKNIAAFLRFLTIRPNEVRGFNNGQFSQTAEALGDAVIDVCLTAKEYTDDSDEASLFKPLTTYDPLIDSVNLSDFDFEYRFQHDQPEGFLPLTRRAFPVLQLDVDYDDDNFPDASGDLWTHQTAELLITINNYEYFALPESGIPGAIQPENGSYPCYYTDPNFHGVYRFPLRDCNPETLIEDAPPGMTLIDAVRKVTVDFIEQNIDAAGAPVKVEDDVEAEVCCVTQRSGLGDFYFMTEIDQCVAPDGGPGEVAPARFCGIEDDDAEITPFADDADEDTDVGQTGRSVCCQDYSGISPENFWADRFWCEDQDDHAVVADALCRR